jgi:hypothetical protein
MTQQHLRTLSHSAAALPFDKARARSNRTASQRIAAHYFSYLLRFMEISGGLHTQRTEEKKKHGFFNHR